MTESIGSGAGKRLASRRFRFAVIATTLLAGAGVGSAAGLLTHHSAAASPVATPAAVWAPGTRRAPDFRLHDERGVPVSLRSFPGRAVILTFIDPLCRQLCPLEARVLSNALRRQPSASRPASLAVSVNPWGDDKDSLAQDRQHWQLGPDWRWALGSRAELERVWHDYGIGVFTSTKTLVGVTVHDVTHTEASYLIDATGHERALLIYPYSVDAVTAAIAGLEASRGA